MNDGVLDIIRFLIIWNNNISDKSQLMKQEVINFEFDVIQRECGNSMFVPRNDPHNYRYSSWDLHDLLQQIGDLHDFKLKWIGNEHNSNILALFYCLLLGTLKEDSEEDLFINLKHCLYQISKEWLNLSEQKIFVEHLCLVQYSKSVAEFLKKSNHFQAIIIKIFTAQIAEMNKKSSSSSPSKIEQLSIVCSLFPFITFDLYNEKLAHLSINNQSYYIVEEKECVFIAELEKKSESTQSTLKKKWIRTEPNHLEPEKTIKQQSLSDVKEGTPKFLVRNSVSGNLHGSKFVKEKITPFNEGEAEETNQFKKKGPDHKTATEEKALQLSDKNKFKKIMSQDPVRTSLGHGDQLHSSYLTRKQKMTPNMHHSKSNKKPSPNITEPKSSIKSKHTETKPTQGRQGFIYQSLGVNDKIPLIQKKPKNKIPKFLEKKKVQTFCIEGQEKSGSPLKRQKNDGVNSPGQRSMNFTFTHFNSNEPGRRI